MVEKNMTANIKPLVSIIVAYYNNINHIEDAIISAVSQTYPNIEIIVVDDGSPDEEARDLIRHLSQVYRFALISKTTNEGASRAFQAAFQASRGDYISILSHDDLYAKDKIEICINEILENKLDAVYANGATFESDIKDSRPFDSTEVVKALEIGQHKVADLISGSDEVGSLLTQGAVYSRGVMNDLDWVRSRFILDDWPFTILVWRNYKVSFIDRVVYYYRFHDHNTHKNYWRWLPARIQTIAELVDFEKRIDVFSFMLSSMSAASRRDGDYDQCLKFAVCACILAESDSNVGRAESEFIESYKKTSLYQRRMIMTSIKRILFMQSILRKIIIGCMRRLIGIIPGKANRKMLRKKVRRL